MNKKTMKFIGFGCMALGFIVSVVQKQMDDQKLEEMIDEKVQEKINQLEK